VLHSAYSFSKAVTAIKDSLEAMVSVLSSLNGSVLAISLNSKLELAIRFIAINYILYYFGHTLQQAIYGTSFC